MTPFKEQYEFYEGWLLRVSEELHWQKIFADAYGLEKNKRHASLLRELLLLILPTRNRYRKIIQKNDISKKQEIYG